MNYQIPYSDLAETESVPFLRGQRCGLDTWVGRYKMQTQSSLGVQAEAAPPAPWFSLLSIHTYRVLSLNTGVISVEKYEENVLSSPNACKY